MNAAPVDRPDTPVPSVFVGRLGAWWPVRVRTAAAGVALAMGTAWGAVLAGGLERPALGGGLYLIVAVGAAFVPAGITLQVVVGQIMVGALMLAPGGPPGWVLAVLVAGVVATAELLAAAARMDAAAARDGAGTAPRTAGAAAAATLAFALVLGVAALPGLGGLLGVLIAAAACAGVATLVAREAG